MSKQFIHGLVLIDAEGAALNNQGLNKKSGYENAVEVKKIIKNTSTYVYVSGQAWRYWWLQTLALDRGWKLSVVSRDEKIARVAIDPFLYPNDDLFGYMYAKKREKNNKTGDREDVPPELGDKSNAKEDKKTDDGGSAVSRVSPLKNSILVSASPVRVSHDFGVMSRQEGDPVPYEKEIYSATLKGMFSIDLDEAGTFSHQNRSGFLNLTDKQYQLHEHDSGVRIVDDLMMRDPKSGQPLERLRLPADQRRTRILDLIQALKTLAGGAKAATNLAAVAPSFIVLGLQDGGNHIFSHLVVDRDGVPTISLDAFRQTIEDYGKQLHFPVVVGRNTGFMDDRNAELTAMAKEGLITYASVPVAIDQFCKQAESFID